MVALVARKDVGMYSSLPCRDHRISGDGVGRGQVGSEVFGNLLEERLEIFSRTFCKILDGAVVG